MFFVFQSTINVKHYNNPAKRITLELDNIQVDNTLNYYSIYHINDTQLKTDRGSIFENWTNETFPIVEKQITNIHMRSNAKISYNYTIHGRPPNQDYFCFQETQ